ncbi:MAG: sugar O-acetyltransferase [Eubacteriales bacterium]|nr:sugar O-acetyltransferase [Eubacteriales bacterium]
MTQKERMEAGLVYDPIDKEIIDDQAQRLELMYEFNASRPSEIEKRTELLNRMLGKIGKECYIEPPFRANWAGKNLYLGDNVYVNFNLTIVDDADIFIGNRVMIGPNVTIATANHPISPELRARSLQYNKSVSIGNNVWIGAGAIIVPGITIGDNSVIGAGSVVTKDIPANVVAVGNPCKILREIGEQDEIYFYKNEKIDWENLGR